MLEDLLDQVFGNIDVTAAKAWMKAQTSSRPRSESAASCKPAAQPSVRSSRAAISSKDKSNPIVLFRNSFVAAMLKRRSWARISTSWLRARKRASGERGSVREDSRR